MKTLEQVREELKEKSNSNYAEKGVFTIEKFAEMIKNGIVTPTSGIGYFHDGEKEVNISVFSHQVSFYEVYRKYPYVCWYNN